MSRIVAPGEAMGPVSLGRMDIDIVVTEYGAADLRGLDHDERARALIAISPTRSCATVSRSKWWTLSQKSLTNKQGEAKWVNAR